MAAFTLIPDTLLVVLLFGALLGGMALEKTHASWRRREWQKRNAGRRSPSGSNLTFGGSVRQATASFDSPAQLRHVMTAAFSKRRLLSKSEARVLYCAEQTILDAKLPWRVMGQVSLGEILSSPDKSAFAAINSKRVDLLIIENGGMPVAAIEYQGGGHYQKDAAARDAVKKEALRRAGIHYIEMTEGHSPMDLSAEILRIARIAEPVGSS